MIRLFNYRTIVFGAALALFAQGCDSTTGLTSQVQDIGEVQWRTGSDAMIGFVQAFVSTPNLPDPGVSYELTRINGNGDLGTSFYTDKRSIPDFSHAIFLTSDDKYAITQLGNDAYRVDLAAGQDQRLVVDYHLIAVSPDGNFLVGSHSPGGVPIKSVTIYDISIGALRTVFKFDVPGLANSRGVWLNDGKIALTVNDSVGYHIDIVDTLGNLIHRIGGAKTPSHNVKFIPATNHLYFRAEDGSIGMYDVTAGTESQPIHFAVENFDLSQDEKTLFYTERTGDKIVLNKLNLLTSNETQLADDVVWGAFLSPDEKKIAYVREKETNFMVIRVINLP